MRFIKSHWRDIAILVLIINLVVGTAIPALADVIKIQPVPALDDLTDVNAPSPDDEDVLAWNDTSNEWVSMEMASGLWEQDGGDTELITPDDIDFQGYQAIAMACQNGDTFPTPTDGMWFRHQITGRDILYQYDGTTSEWYPIMSFGDITIYVDADGTDDLDHGTSQDTDAFDTVQYAIDCIPSLYDGDVYVYLSADDFDETVYIRNKHALSDPNSIYIYGTLSQLELVSSSIVYAGSGCSQGVVQDNEFDGSSVFKLIYFMTDEEYRVIQSWLGITYFVVGTCPSSTTQSTRTLGWGTTINEVYIEYSDSVYLYDIEFDNDFYGLYVRYRSDVSVYRCNFAGSDRGAACQDSSRLHMDTCVMPSIDDYGVVCQYSVQVFINRTYIEIDEASGYGIYAYYETFARAAYGTYLYGNNLASTCGIISARGSYVNRYNNSAYGYLQIDDFATGCRATEWTGITGANTCFTSCTTKESADASSYAGS